MTLKISDLDKISSSASNLICWVVEIDYNHSLHELVSEAEFLNTMFARNAFAKLEAKELPLTKFDLIKQLSMRQAAGLVYIGGGQGMLKCNCPGDFSRRTFTCRNHKVLCNSLCNSFY